MPRSARKAAASSVTASKKSTTGATTATDNKKESTKKRTRATTATASASGEMNESPAVYEEMGEKERKEDETSQLRKRTKRETANVEVPAATTAVATRSKRQWCTNNAGTKKKQKRKDLDRDEDEEMGEKAEDEEEEEEEEEELQERDNLVPSPLAHLTTQKYGRIFEVAREDEEAMKTRTSEQEAKTVNLPQFLMHYICDFLSVKSLVTLAYVARSSYATVREYGETVILGESKRSIASDPLGDDIEFIGSVAGPVNPHPQHRLGARHLDTSQWMRNQSWTTLLESQLRHLVTSIIVDHSISLSQVAPVSNALPHLRELVFLGLYSSKEKTMVLPQYLRTLTLTFAQTVGHEPRSSSWLVRLTTTIRKLKYLNEFRFLCSDLEEQHAEVLLDSIAAMPRLRLFHSGFPDLIATSEMWVALPETLTSLSQCVNQDLSEIPQIFEAISEETIKEESAAATSGRLQLQNLDACRSLKEDFIEPISKYASTLTSLNPALWSTHRVKWLSEFKRLKVLTINTSERAGYYFTSNDQIRFIGSIEETFKIRMASLVETLCQLTQLTRLRLFVHRLSNQQLETILRSLTSLQHLQIGSNKVTSIMCFSQIPHLVHQLDTLKIRFPTLSRDEVVHLYSLRWLGELDIEGSFIDPLYARQLLPLRSPTVQQPYLKKFIPRGQNEPVPIPPIDLAVQTKERIEFDERIRSGDVCAAEMINSDQLSIILQQLDIKEFSHCGRVCRSWRTAASLRSAWASNNTGRILVLDGDAPECVPSILPHLALWRYARRVRFTLQVLPVPQSSIIAALDAVSQLSRLESLDMHNPRSDTANIIPPVRSFLSQLASRLIVLRFHSSLHSHYIDPYAPHVTIPPIPSPPSPEFPCLRELDIKHAEHLIQPKWSTMSQLQSLKTNEMTHELGHELRHLSLQHQFRRLEVTVTEGKYNLERFLLQLIDSPSPISHNPPAVLVAPAAALVPFESGSQPAAIESVHIYFQQPDAVLNLDPLFYLPRLTEVRIEVIIVSRSFISFSSTVWNLAQLSQKNVFQRLERFHYAGAIDPDQLVHLTHLKQLRSFTWIDPGHMFHTRATNEYRTWGHKNCSSIPDGYITQWMKAWTRLEEFHLEGIQIIGSELKALMSVSDTLRSFHLHYVSTIPLSVNDLSFLPSLTRLESLELVCILGLTLTPREDCAAATSPLHDADGDIEMNSNKAALAAASSGTSSSSLIEYIRSCPQLRELTWCLHPTELDASIAFTLSLSASDDSSLSDRREHEWGCERNTLARLPTTHSLVIRYISGATQLFNKPELIVPLA